MADINDLIDALTSNAKNDEFLYMDDYEDEDNNNLEEKLDDVLTRFKDSPLSATLTEMVKTVRANQQVLKTARQLAEQTSEAGYLESYANVSKANSETLKIISLMLSEQAKLEAAEKLKAIDSEEKEKDRRLKLEIAKMQIESKERLAEGKSNKPPALQQNNVYLSATRDEMLAAIKGDKKVMAEILKENGIVEEAELVTNDT